MTFNELVNRMIDDSTFSFKSRLTALLSKLSYDEIIPAYNIAMANMNVEDMDYDFTLTYDQLMLVGQVFLTTSLERYENAFGSEWVKSHTRHHRKTDLCISLNPAGFIETHKSYTNMDFTSSVVKYLVESEDVFTGLKMIRLDMLHGDILHMIEEYAKQHGIDMKHLDRYTEEEKKLNAQMAKAYSSASDEEAEGF